MVFTSFAYFIFLAVIVAGHWLLPGKLGRNLWLLAGSYFFFGYIHPWFCLLIAASTIVDYLCGLGMEKWTHRKRLFLIVSLAANLGLLGFFKYFNFFADECIAAINGLGFDAHPLTLRIFLPVGISFYTFQTLSYTIDIYRGQERPRRNFVDFALFVALFPQLVAGPIERSQRLLPQVENARRWSWSFVGEAWPLFIRGYVKKMVIADNISIYADKVYGLEQPSLFLLAAGTLAFAVQIYADFSAYTDIARGSARLLGFDLMENFRSPYLAISPSDFWRRWHISLSTWIRDYLYIPLGGSRVTSKFRFGLVVGITFLLAGLWHGAAWHFVAWGLFHAIILFIYHALGFSGKWTPAPGIKFKNFLAWAVMFTLTMLGWMIFRTDNLAWLAQVFGPERQIGMNGDSWVVGITIMALVGLYSLPLFVLMGLDRLAPHKRWLHNLTYGIFLVLILILGREGGQDFIYFQF